MFCLIDCNNFFASCETLFNPTYRKRPLVVLSNNDGCIIARSKEAKQLGIPMGAPLFQYKEFFNKNHVILCSSNFPLYHDMSQRVVTTLEQSGYPLEQYSIDESFLSLPSLTKSELLLFGQQCQEKVFRWTGIPVSIGIAPTKTLAKIANFYAKHKEQPFLLLPPFTPYLKQFAIENVWGIGRKMSSFLKKEGIFTPHDLLQKERSWARNHLTVSGERLYLELQGIPCHMLQVEERPHQSILSSRSFGVPIKKKEELKEALSSFVSSATKKLRTYNLSAGMLTIFIRSSPHKHPFFSKAAHRLIPIRTEYTPDLINEAHALLEHIFCEGIAYKKAGVLLSDFYTSSETQLDCLTKHPNQEKKKDLMHLLDTVNQRYGKDALYYASCGKNQKWRGKKEIRSPEYTTSWDEIPIIHI